MAPPARDLMIKDDPRKNMRLHRQSRTAVEPPSAPNDPHASLGQIQLTLCSLESKIEELRPACESALRKKQNALAERQRAETEYQARQAKHRDKMQASVLRLIGDTSKSEQQKREEVTVVRRAAFLRRYCRPVVKELMNSRWGYIFNQPVDAERLGLSDYHEIIKHPMDLGTVNKKIDKNNDYTPSNVASDVRLTFNNATAYNPKGHVVHGAAQELLQRFEQSWASQVEPYFDNLDDIIEWDMAVIREGDKMAYYDSVHNEATTEVETQLDELERKASELAECKAQLRSMCRNFPESQLRSLSERLKRLHPTLADRVADITLDDPNSSDVFPSSESLRLDLSSLDTITLARLQHLTRVSTYAQWAPQHARAIAPSAVFEDDIIDTSFPREDGKELGQAGDALDIETEEAEQAQGPQWNAKWQRYAARDDGKQGEEGEMEQKPGQQKRLNGEQQQHEGERSRDVDGAAGS
jgi:hypothetical protein